MNLNRYVNKELGALGYSVLRIDGTYIIEDVHGNQSPEIDLAVQTIVDSYDPLPEAKAAAINSVNTKAGEVRTRYVTAVPSQDATYQMKLEDAKAFRDAGYPEDAISSYPFIVGEAEALQSTGEVAATLIITTAQGWTYLASAIENERRVTTESIKRCTDWTLCSGIASEAIARLDAL